MLYTEAVNSRYPLSFNKPLFWFALVSQAEMRVEVQDRMLEWRGDGNADAWRNGARSSVGPKGHDYARTAGDRADLEALGVDASEVGEPRARERERG